MRPDLVLLSLVAAIGVGCAGAAPTRIAAAPQPARVEVPPAAPLVRLAAAELVEVEPVGPPPVPGLRIDRRSVFERANAVQWTLANGLTVVYVQDASASRYYARVVLPGGWAVVPDDRRGFYRSLGELRWGPLRARVEEEERRVRGEASTLADLTGAVARLLTAEPEEVEAAADVPPAVLARLADEAFEPSPDVLVILLGPRGPEWVESAVAGTLGRLPARRDAFSVGARSMPAEGLAVDWDDVPAIRVLDRVLANRAAEIGGEASVVYRPRQGRAMAAAEGARPLLFAPLTDASIRRARDAAARDAATPEGRIEAFADLYSLPGDFRPARDPSEAAQLAGRIARVAPSTVSALLARFSAAR